MFLFNAPDELSVTPHAIAGIQLEFTGSTS